jgi:hypothetical protein
MQPEKQQISGKFGIFLQKTVFFPVFWGVIDKTPSISGVLSHLIGDKPSITTYENLLDIALRSSPHNEIQPFLSVHNATDVRVEFPAVKRPFTYVRNQSPLKAFNQGAVQK